MSNKIAFYRKYRPNSFHEIIGQKFIIKTLSNSIIKNKQSHAYIFSGPKGVGKTSIAKIFSKVLNCLNLKDGDCCNNCNNCNLINQNQAIDIVELDAASNNGVGEVRNIIDNINYLPSVLKYKVYIIDEAHMLSNAAWNAFLKLIEDPPKYLIFIFATTESYKFPPTIISRCQRYNFLKLNNSELKSCLLNISKKEKIKIEDQALNKIAELADGSLRDACSLIDQLDSYTNSNITLEDIYDVFGILDINEKINLLKFIWNSNVEQIIKKINDYEVKGIDFYQLSIDLINLLYDKLVFERTKNSSLLKYLPNDQTNFLELQPKFIIKCLEVWQDNLNKIKTSSNQKFFFQLACFESSKLFEFGFDINVTTSSYISKNNEEIKQELEPKVNVVKNTLINNEEKNKDNVIVSKDDNKKETSSNLNSSKNSKNKDESKTVDLLAIDTSNFRQVKLSDSMKVVQINGSSNENKVEEKKLDTTKDRKINIVDNFVDNFVKVNHLEQNADIISEFDIVGKKTKNKTNKNTQRNTKQETVEIKEVIENNVTAKTDIVENKKENIETNDLSLFSFDNIEDVSPVENSLEEQFEAIEEVNISEINTESKKSKKKNKQSIKENNQKNNKEEIYINIDIDDAFLKIAINANNNQREKVNLFFEEIKKSTPLNSFESSIKQMNKLIVASDNGIAFLSDDDIETENLNKNNQSLEFLEYLKNKLNKVYLVIAISKEQAVRIGDKIRAQKLKPADVQDVDIEFLNTKIKSKPTAKDLAESILNDLIIDEE